MSFRTRLTSFFVVIVVVPMIAVGVLVYSLISDSEQAKAEARANGLATAAASLYASASTAARADAQTIARSPALLKGGATIATQASSLAAKAGLARVTVTAGSKTVADVGSPTAVAPGVANVSLTSGGQVATVSVSELTAAGYARMLAGPGVAVVIRDGASTLAATIGGVSDRTLPRQDKVTVAGHGYETSTFDVAGFGGARLTVTVLSSLSATASSIGTTRLLAAVFIVAFLLLALAFSVLASRALQGQLSRFLQAARRLAGGDFSSPVPTTGSDEFAALGQEFNNMSVELEKRLLELSAERARLRDSIRRIGDTLASNLNGPALLQVVLQTAVDAMQSRAGRVSALVNGNLAETSRAGSLNGFEEGVYEAERIALRTGAPAEHAHDGAAVISVPLGPAQDDGGAQGLLTVARRLHPFSGEERALLQSLAAQATLALENVDLHVQISRQAVTDELTGLVNHGRFQETLSAEVEQVRRYRHPLGLIMLDLDDFKAINDTYGHPQGDLVLEAVGRVVSENSRDADTPARYGGEEMALILPHTDLDGAYAIAERVRTAIDALRVPRMDGDGTLRVTASVGVSVSRQGDREALVAEADAALYEAKRQGKNRTVRSPERTANLTAGE